MLINYNGFNVKLFFTKHMDERLSQRDIRIKEVRELFIDMIKEDYILDLAIGTKFSVVNKNEDLILVFKVLNNPHSLYDVDVLLITAISRTMPTYFGINNIPVIDLYNKSISYGYNILTVKEKGKEKIKKTKKHNFKMNDINMFYKSLKNLV